VSKAEPSVKTGPDEGESEKGRSGAPRVCIEQGEVVFGFSKELKAMGEFPGRFKQESLRQPCRARWEGLELRGSAPPHPVTDSVGVLVAKRTKVDLLTEPPLVKCLTDMERPCHKRDEGALLAWRKPTLWSEELNRGSAPNRLGEKTRGRGALLFTKTPEQRSNNAANEGLNVHPEEKPLREASDELLPMRLRQEQKKRAKKAPPDYPCRINNKRDRGMRNLSPARRGVAESGRDSESLAEPRRK